VAQKPVVTLKFEHAATAVAFRKLDPNGRSVAYSEGCGNSKVGSDLDKIGFS
jgi:hypothetical protein